MANERRSCGDRATVARSTLAIKGRPYNADSRAMKVEENRLSPSSLISATSLAVAVAFFAVSARSIVEALLLPANPSSDFAAFWRAGGWIRNRAEQSLYPLSSFGNSAGGSFPERYLGFVNPPHVAPPFSLLADLPLGRAFACFTVVNIASLVLVLIFLGRTLHQYRWASTATATALALTAGSAATAAVIVNGTLSLISVVGLLMMLPSTRLDNSGSDWLPALGLALLSFKPQYAILPAVLLFSQHRWSILTRAAVLISALIGASLTATGIKPWVEYLPFLSRYAETADLWQVSDAEAWLPKQMPNLRGLSFRILDLDNIATVNRLSTIALIVAVGFVWWIGHQTHRNTNLVWALTIALTLFTSQHSNVCDGVILIVILVAVVRANDERFTQPRVLGAFALLQISFTFGNPARTTPLLPWSAIGIGALLALLVAVASLARRPTQPPANWRKTGLFGWFSSD